MKKYLSLLLILFLCACSTNETNKEKVIEVDEYLEPVNEVEVFTYLNSETKNLLYKANNNHEISTHILELLGKDLLDYELSDYYGNKINLSDYQDQKLIIELAASWCTHCMEQSKSHNKALLEAYPDITLIQYFNDGDKEGIANFYQEINQDIPTNIIVVPEDKTFSNELLSKYNPEYYPAFLIFNEGKLTFISVAELTVEELDQAYAVAFENAYDVNNLVDENGQSIFNYTRNSEDVKNDLSKQNYEKLVALDNDEYTIKNTLEFIGSDIDYFNQLEDDSYFESEVDFTSLAEKEVVIIYYGDLDAEVNQMLNDYVDSHPEIEVIVLDVYDENVDNLKGQLTAKVASIMNQIPQVLNDITFNTYPSAVFVRKGIITGAYSSIEDIGKLNQATELFLGETSIALKKNN